MSKTEGIESLLSASSSGVEYFDRDPDAAYTVERKKELQEAALQVKDQPGNIGTRLLDHYEDPESKGNLAIHDLASRLENHSDLDAWIWSWFLSMEADNNSEGDLLLKRLIRMVPVESDIGKSQDRMSLLRIDELLSSSALNGQNGHHTANLARRARKAIRDGDSELRESTRMRVSTKLRHSTTLLHQNILTSLSGMLEGGPMYYRSAFRSRDAFRIRGIEDPFQKELSILRRTFT